ncbi:MAG: hypothetical protein Q9161_008540 [Pseudevernia consocians]
MSRISRRSPPQATAPQLARSIKTADQQTENRDIIGTSRKLTVEQRLPEVRKAQKVTLKGTTNLEGAYVQIRGPTPQEHGSVGFDDNTHLTSRGSDLNRSLAQA